MSSDIVSPLPFVAAGFLVGGLVGLTGVGGGSLMTPLLVLLFGFHPATAVGTDLLYAGATKFSGSAIHNLRGSIDWRVVRRLAMGSAPAAAVTVLALKTFGAASEKTNALMSTALGFALLLTAMTLLFRPWLVARGATLFAGLTEQRTGAMTVALGVVLGVLVSITSVGAGAIGVTVLLALYPKMPTLRIVGSDIAHAVPLTLIAGAGHWWLGSIDWTLLIFLLAGSIPGIAVSSLFAPYVPDHVLRTLLAAVLALVGAKLVA